MRTLKRTMCLVLSMVMLLGVCTVFVSAENAVTNLEKYTDKNDIKYKEAVDVLTGIGVLQGDAAGFRPKDKINRAEAAKIIAYLLIGNATAADALKATAQTFTDVDKDWWAAGYIAYCAERGIVNGRGNGIYDPLANVTGIEFVKMLLCAIGYGVNGEYTGAMWSINVAKDGVQYGIFDGNLAGASEADATREECALYAFNTLELKKVTYSALYGGYIENVGLGIAGNPNQAESNKKPTIADDYELKKNKIKDHADYWNNYGGATSIESDAFFRPTGYFWYQKYEAYPVSGHYAEDYLLKTFTGPVTASDIYNLLAEKYGANVVSRLYAMGTAQKTDSIGFRAFENGGQYVIENSDDYAQFYNATTNTNSKSFATVPANQQQFVTKNVNNYGTVLVPELKSNYTFIRVEEPTSNGFEPVFTARNNKILAHTGNGVETEVYGITDEDGNLVEVRLVLVHNYLAKVDSAVGGKVTVKFPTAEEGLVTYQRTGNYNVRNFSKLTFETTQSVARRDYVIVNYSWRADSGFNEGIQDMTYPTKLNNRITRYANADNTVGVADKVYRIALDDAVMSDSQTRGSAINNSLVNNISYTIYLDTHDNVIGIDTVIAPKNFVYVSWYGYKFNTSDALTDVLDLTAEIWDSAGNSSVKVVNIDSKSGSNLNGISRSLLEEKWNEASMRNGERDFLDNLNYSDRLYYSVGLYQMETLSDGTVKLTDVETYAANLGTPGKTVRNEVIQTAAGNKDYKGAAIKVFQNDSRLGSNLTATGGVNSNYVLGNTTNPVYNYSLQSDSETIFFYVSGQHGNKLSVKTYIGYKNAPDTDDKDDSRSVVSWFAETKESRGNFNVYADAVLVTGTDNRSKPTTEEPVYVYLDNGKENIKGNFVKNGPLADGKYEVQFTVYKANEGNNVPEVVTFTYDDQDKADAAISGAADLIDSWVVKGDKGLSEFVPANIEKKSGTDKVNYIGATTVFSVDDDTITLNAVRKTNTGNIRNINLATNDDTAVYDLRVAVADSDRIDSVIKIENLLNNRMPDGEPRIDGKGPQYCSVLVVEDDTNKAIALYVIDVGARAIVSNGNMTGDANVTVTGRGTYVYEGSGCIAVQNNDKNNDILVKVTAYESTSGNVINVTPDTSSEAVTVGKDSTQYFTFGVTDYNIVVDVDAQIKPAG